MNTDFLDTVDYLANGTQVQRHIFDIIQKSNVMNLLAEFNPILAGTFPLGIEVENSDLDVICCVNDKEKFVEINRTYFSSYDSFSISDPKDDINKTILVNFRFMNVEFEIFGQNKPTKEQNAYIHMVNEYKLLHMHGEDFRKKVIELKKKGMKTEPAFACLLGLEGDPYKAMLTVLD